MKRELERMTEMPISLARGWHSGRLRFIWGGRADDARQREWTKFAAPVLLASALIASPAVGLCQSPYQLPFQGGTMVYISVGHAGDDGGIHSSYFSGTQKEKYAWDMREQLKKDVKIVAARGGVATLVKKNGVDHGFGANNCPDNIFNYASDAAYVVVDHGDGTQALYLHLTDGSVLVNQGDNVHAGQVLGTIGNTGASCGAHLHFQVENSASSWFTQSVASTFSDSDVVAKTPANDGVPRRKMTYLSSNYGDGIQIVPAENDKTSGNCTITGTFSSSIGKVAVTVPSTPQNQALFAQVSPYQSIPSYNYDASIAPYSSTTSISVNIFNDQMKWETFYSPVMIKVYGSDNTTKMGEAWYPFSDVPATYWAANAIQSLYLLGIVNGKGSGLYDPSAEVSRSEFLTMLLRAKLGHALNFIPAEKPFDDVTTTGPASWFAPYAAYAKTKTPTPYVNGNPCAGNASAVCFRPNDSITRFEASVMATNVFELSYYNPDIAPSWQDYNTGTFGYAPWIAFSHGIMSGYDQLHFGTNDTLKRDQAAVLVNAAMKSVTP